MKHAVGNSRADQDRRDALTCNLALVVTMLTPATVHAQQFGGDNQ